MIMNSAVPKGRATKARAKMAKAYSVPVSGSAKGKKRAGKTRMDARPYTKKSKYSDALPMTTPTAMSLGATSECALSSGDVFRTGAFMEAVIIAFSLTLIKDKTGATSTFFVVVAP